MDPNRNRLYLGLDLGQRHDPSAVAVVEWVEESLLLRHVERVPLGTPYPKVVGRMRRMVRHAELRGQCALAADATGVGAPVVEMLRAAGRIELRGLRGDDHGRRAGESDRVRV